MADIETTTVNEEKYHALSRAGEFELSIDATAAEGPTPNEVLIADYASCFTFACRAGANRHLDVDLGEIETEAEADLDDDQLEEVVELGEEICHVHDALKESLYADVEVTPNAF